MFYILENPELIQDEIFDEITDRIYNSQCSKSLIEDSEKLMIYLRNNTHKQHSYWTAAYQSDLSFKDLKEQLSLKSSLKKIWSTISSYSTESLDSLPKNGYCPICGIGVSIPSNINPRRRNIYSVDHVLPKTDHINYICFPNNLVQICMTCNHNKRSKSVDPNLVHHPYYNDYEDTYNGLEIHLTSDSVDSFEFNFSLVDETSPSKKFCFKELYRMDSIYYNYAMEYLNEAVYTPLERFNFPINETIDKSELILSIVISELAKIGDVIDVEGQIAKLTLNLVKDNIDTFVIDLVNKMNL